jgi:hypothetical protein
MKRTSKTCRIATAVRKWTMFPAKMSGTKTERVNIMTDKDKSTIQRMIGKMTPSSTLQMIRDGINPLTTDMSELENYFNDKSDDPNHEMETYSRYLYNLEQNKDITPEERDAYYN